MSWCRVLVLVVVTLVLECPGGEGIGQEPHRIFQMKLVNPVRAIGKKLHKVTLREICYDTVGCFEVSRRHMPLTRLPESPEYLDTEFYLFTRKSDLEVPQVLEYGQGRDSLAKCNFDPNKKVKILIHGFMTTWNETGALKGIKAFLDNEDFNVIIVNWERGARGPRYTTAAANTEVVGRQLGILLLDMMEYGVKPQQIHLVGFSLGAHVAAVASELLKQQGLLVNRITGLDPASPLFKLDHFKDKKKKLDKSDAVYVDVIHTDGSPTFTDGFGLLEPLGHVDFYPNGGQAQPGCNDIKASVVVSQLEGTLDRELACSHIRAYALYLNTLLQASRPSSGCQFLAWNCPRGPLDFQQGRCFPRKDTSAKLFGKMGEQSYGEGAMYLVTRKEMPFCGTPLQVVAYISSETKPTRGVLDINLYHGNTTTNFQVNVEIQDRVHPDKQFFGLSAAEYGTLENYKGNITAELLYQRRRGDDSLDRNRILLRSASLILEKLEIRTINEESWSYCGKNIMFSESKNFKSESLVVSLKAGSC